MKASTDPLILERRARMYGHPSSVADREAARPKPASAEQLLRRRQADETADLADRHRREASALRRDQDRENRAQSTQGVPYPEAANLRRHEVERRKLQDRQQGERQ